MPPDIGSHLVAADGLGVPGSYADIFYLLSDAGIMPRPFADKMANLAGFRNLLVHDYTKVKPEKVYANLKRLDDFHDFARYITAYLERQPL